jgi:recombination protein RecA
MGVEHEMIEKSGPWYSYASERIGQGRENARIFLADNPDTCEEIRRKILEKAGFAQKGKRVAAEGVKKEGEGVEEAAEDVKKQERRKKGG